MAEIQPFKGLLYNNNKIEEIEKVLAPPYDIITPEEQEEFHLKSPYNIIRLELGKEFPEDNDSDNRYTRAAKLLDEWIEKKILIYSDKPALYIYQQQYTIGNCQNITRGIITRVRLEELSAGKILPHERTLSKPKKDRYNLLSACQANLSQIYALYADKSQRVEKILEKSVEKVPYLEVELDGVISTLWVIDNENDIRIIQDTLKDKVLFIADGHHRYETSLQYRNDLNEKAGLNSNAPYNYIMMMLVDLLNEDLTILPTHRLLRHLDNDIVDNLEGVLEKHFSLLKFDSESEEINELRDEAFGELHLSGLTFNSFLFYRKDQGFMLAKLKKSVQLEELIISKNSIDWKRLDVSILHKLIIDELLNQKVHDLEAEDSLKFTIDDTQALNLVDSSTYQLAIFLNPTRVHEIQLIAENHEKMPQKSTYFFPKLLTGLVVNKF